MVNVTKRSKEKTIGPCPCELCSRWYCEERKKKETGTTVVWIDGYDCGVLHITDRACTHNSYVVSGLG